MITYNPLIALFLFAAITLLLFLLFRPTKGWFWLIKSSQNNNEKTVIEDVLKQLYHNEMSGGELNVNSLAGILKVRDSFLLEVLQEMTHNELLTIERDVLKLTNEGRDYALRIVRVHRLWEKYLAEKTGYKKEEWHDRAELMEHKLNLEETNLLANQLGNPLYDPHGDPIPSKTGRIATVEGIPLSNLPINTVGRITHIEDEPEIIYKQILAEKIHIGSQIRVVENNKERIVFYAEGEEFKLAPVVAANLTVAVLEKEAVKEDNMVRLSNLKLNEEAEVLGISKECRGENRRRLLDLGFVKGADISIDMLSPLKNPKAYLIKGTSIALRDDQASKILIQKH